MQTTNNQKRKRSDDDNDQPPQKLPKTTLHIPFYVEDSNQDEENDLNHTAWNLHKLNEPNDCFGHVQNQWRPRIATNPHKNHSFRFNATNLKTGFFLRGCDNHYVPMENVYNDQMIVVQNSIKRLQTEISAARRNYRKGLQGIISKARLDYLVNYRNQLRNHLMRLEEAKESANSIFSYYCAPIFGQDANQITTLQKAEAEHTLRVFNSLKEFYSRPS